MLMMDMVGANVQVERDHSPLLDVEAVLFDGFLFEGSSASVSRSSSSGVERGEALTAAGVDLKGGVLSPVDIGVTSTSTPSSHSSSLYSDLACLI